MMYTIGFVLTLFALMGIMLNRDGLKPLTYMFLPGIILWLVGISGHASSASAFFAQAFFDLIFMGGAAMVFRGLSHSVSFAIPGSLIALFSMTAAHGIVESSMQHVEKSDVVYENYFAEEAEILVELQNDINGDRWKKWIGAQGWETRLAFSLMYGETTELDDYYIVNIPSASESELQEAVHKIKASGIIDWLELNELIQVELQPSEMIVPSNKALGVNDPKVKEQWAMNALQMDQFYAMLKEEKYKPKKKTLVAILDTGVDAAHEDLKSNFHSIDKKFDNDPRGHGTHCAGIAGAVTNNGVGVASFARTSDYFNITSVKVLKAGGSGSQQEIIQGILTAVDQGADVLSLSLGGFSTQSRQRAYSQAVKYATDRGAIVVAAAGNSNRDAAGYTPVNATGMIGVSAVDNQLKRADFSNRVGRIDMAVAAPGVGIYSTKPNNTYNSHNGTSMATPFVSGLIGVMKSIYPELTNKQAFKILHETGVKTKDTSNTGRLIQPAKAVKALVDRANFD